MKSIADISLGFSTSDLRLLSDIVYQSPHSIILIDIEGRIKYVNLSYVESTGFNSEEVRGTIPQFVESDENDNKIKEMWQAIENKREWKGELLILKKSGNSYWNSIAVSPLKNEVGSITHYLILGQDINEKKELELELKRALAKSKEVNEFKSYLLGNLNHEIRTPMNSIIGFAQIMNEEVENDSVREMSDKIIKSSYRLLNTLNAIIELSDLESERIKVNNSKIELSELVKYLRYIYKKQIEEKDLKFEVEIKKENLVISSDEKLLEQILKNLIENAIKYTEKGTIKIRLDTLMEDPDKSYAVITVSDTGIGIPNQNKEFIFDAFRQASEGVKRRYQGSGLGLTIAQKMIRLLNGRIELESKEGVGSKFSVYIPISKNQVILKKAATSESQKSEKKESGELPKLLIVEDYIMNIDIMKYFLNDLAIIRHATSYEETMNQISEQDFDIILMDIILKDSESGLELMKTIREIKHYKHIPIIAITGYTAAEDQEVFINEGFTGFLAKPFDKNQLREIIIQNIYVH